MPVCRWQCKFKPKSHAISAIKPITETEALAIVASLTVLRSGWIADEVSRAIPPSYDDDVRYYREGL